MTKSTIDIDIEHTKLTNHVPTQLPTGTGTTVHSTLLIHDSYNMYIHNMPRDTEAYRQWLTGSRTAGELGRAHAVGVHKPWRHGLHSLEGRLTALLRLVSRVRRGERLQLSCACQEHVLDSCHGDVIVDWVRGRVRPV